MAGERPVLLGLLLYFLIAAAPTLLFWVALRVLPAVAGAVGERRRRRDAASRPALAAADAIEAQVANLRRLRRSVRGRPRPTRLQRLALLGAYDETLVEVCRSAGVEAPLAELLDAPIAPGAGGDRAFARLITEAALEDAGIALDPPIGGTAAA